MTPNAICVQWVEDRMGLCRLPAVREIQRGLGKPMPVCANHVPFLMRK